MAGALAGRRTLVVSTDPAPSLGDAFRQPLGPAPRRIPTRRGTLHAAEIDAPAALGRWLRSRRSGLERIALRGTWLDQEDVARLLRLSLPGIDEIAALIEITRLAASSPFDLVVVDTAPTGHTIRMLETPGTLSAVAGVFEQMQRKHRAIVGALRGSWRPDAEDALMADIEGVAGELSGLLREAARFSWVTLPEPMATEETADAMAALEARGLAVEEIIVNRVTPAPDRRCGWCDARRRFEAGAIRGLQRRVAAVPLAFVAQYDAEPRGGRALARVAAAMRDRAALPPFRAGQVARLPAAGKAPAGRRVMGPETAGVRLVLFGGKGGVGKTTCAAAAALQAARAAPDRRVLLLSADPAHSLADALGAPLSDDPTALPGGPANLRVREIDAARGFCALRDRYSEAIDGWFDRLTRGPAGSLHVDAREDRAVMQRLFDLAPPGIDELVAIIDVIDALDGTRAPGAPGEAAGLIVMDTAPSGHALRLLEMPSLVQDWARALMAILLKYQPVAGVGELGVVLLRVSQGLGRLKRLLADPAQCAFVVVTRAAALPREESRRLMARLAALRMDVPLVLVNAVGRGQCGRCRAASIVEAGEVRRIARMAAAHRRRLQSSRLASRNLHASPVVAVAPSRIPPPHGVAGLERWRESWALHQVPGLGGP